MTDQRNGGIEWTDQTWNPIRGCSKVSQGCKHCYAETMAARFSKPGEPYAEVVTDGRWNGKVVLVPERLADPLRWKRPRRVFVNSMSDLFHESLTNEQIAAVFGVMAAAPMHTFQVLTKRPSRAREWFKWVESEWQEERTSPAYARQSTQSDICLGAAIENGVPGGRRGIRVSLTTPPWPLTNVWLGVSVEDQATAAKRIAHLLRCPAAVRWISAEPLLGRVRLDHLDCDGNGDKDYCQIDALTGRQSDMGRPCADVSRLDWVVVGGESGPGARPMHPDWARCLRDQCQAAGVPFLFKQWGDWTDVGDAHEIAERGIAYAANERCVNLNGSHGFHGQKPRRMRRIGKKAAGRLLDSVIHDGYPEGAQ